MSESTPRARPGCLRRALRGFAALAIGLIVALVAIELGLRWVVLSDSDSARRLGEQLRQPGNFSNEDVDEVFWKLQRRFLPAESFGEVPGYDRNVGWVGDLVLPDTYEHLDAASVGERTPVLFYGDSFAQCVVPKPQCFQGLMERSDLDSKYRLLNYGVGGFGFDQAYLLLTRTIDHWKDKQPIVVLAILVESDLDRCVLDFRGWPKPRLEPDGPDGSSVRLREAGVPTVEEYFQRHSLDAGSLLWRALIYRQLDAIAPWQHRQQFARSRIEEKKTLARAILTSAHRMLEERGVRHFVLLFNVRGPFTDPRYTWQEPFLRETCDSLHMPLISTRPWFDLVVDENWNHADLYYIGKGPGEGHYNAAGNEIAFEALRAGVEGHFGPADTTRLKGKLERKELPSPNDRLRQMVLLDRNTWITARANRSVLRQGKKLGALFDPGDGSEAVCIRGGEEGATVVEFDHDESPMHFRAELIKAKRPGVECEPGRLTVEIRVRGEVRFSGEIDKGSTPVDIDLTGARSLGVVVSSEGGDSECGWVVLAHPRFESR